MPPITTMRTGTETRADEEAAGPAPIPEAEADHEEIEWQFEVIDVRPVQRWLRSEAGRSTLPSPDGAAGQRSGEPPILVESGSIKQIVDTYADTHDWRIFRAGYSLRLRTGDGKMHATLKALSRPAQGIRRRREITERVAGNGVESLAQGDGPVAWRVRALAGRHPLRPVCQVRTHRTNFRLTLGSDQVGSLSLDATAIPLDEGGEPARLRRVEIEVGQEAMPVVAPFVDGLCRMFSLHPASLSKLEAGLLARGELPAMAAPGRVEFGEQASIGEVAFGVLEMQFRSLLDKEPGTRLGEDPEDLHDMRVAARRLRAALALFSAALPVRSQRIRSEIGWLGSALGMVRDLDVQLDQLREWQEAGIADPKALVPVITLLHGRRDAARARLLEVLNSSRYERLIASFSGMLQHGPLRRSPPSRAHALAVGPDLIGARYRSLWKRGRRIGPRSSAEDLHRLRIRAKRLRYAVEFLTPLYGAPAEKLTSRLTDLQNQLGAHQDAQVAIGHLQALAADDGSKLPPETVFVMGRIAERYARRAAKMRRSVPKELRRLQRKVWQDLADTMERRRMAQWAPAPVVAPPPGAGTPAGAG